jgi:hypothetical protein
MKLSSTLYGAGLAALSFLSASPASAQNPAPVSGTPNPVTATASAPKPPENPAAGREAIVRFEMISLPPLAARQALIKYPKEAELYQWLDAEMEKKDSGVTLEKMHAVRVRGGQRSKVEAIHEYAYPTEMDPPQIPQTISINDPSAAKPPKPAGDGRVFAPWPMTSITPSAFTFRNLGFTAEVELTIGEDGKTVDLNLAPEVVRVVGQVPVGINGDVSQPVHETQKVSSQILGTLGQPVLVSTLSPPTGTGVPGGNKSNRVWLLFVTITIPG